MIKGFYRLELICDGGSHACAKDAHLIATERDEVEAFGVAVSRGWLILPGNRAYCKDCWKEISASDLLVRQDNGKDLLEGLEHEWKKKKRKDVLWDGGVENGQRMVETSRVSSKEYFNAEKEA